MAGKLLGSDINHDFGSGDARRVKLEVFGACEQSTRGACERNDIARDADVQAE